MSEIVKAPKKERKFLKTLGKIGEVLLQEVILKIGSNLIKKIGGKKNLPSLLFLFFALSACAQYPATGNKMRLGFQTSGDGLLYRGRAADTVSIKSTGLNNAYFILDTVNNIVYNYIKTKGGWQFTNGDTIIINNTTDTSSLSNRINLKLNKSDTASMLTNYLKSSVNLASQVTGILPLLNGGTGSNTQSGARTNLGGTSIGQYLFTLTNANTNKYARFDANNQVTLLTSSELRTDIGAGVGSVTSVGMTVPTLLSISGSPITTSGTLALTYSGTALPIANGGTNATTNTQARTNLGATVRGANVFTLADISALSFLRYNADNTVSQRGADGMRSDLGGTTIGQSMFTLTNPSAITFPRLNADNTVTARSATDFRTDIGAGTGNGNGTVTNVSASGTPNGLSVATGTTTPVISVALAASGTTGVVSNGTQTFSGSKTFANDLATGGAFSATGFSTLTGGASVGTMATQANLTHVLGVDASNNIGELGLGVGMSVGSGVLSVQAAGASATGLVTSFAQTFGGNKTFNGTVTLASATGTATSVVGRSSTGQVVDVTLGTGLSLSSGTLSATAGNDINVYLAINGPGIALASSFGVYSHWYVNINQASTVTITLPSASGNIYKTLYIKNSGTGAVNSSASNVEPLNSTTLGTAILTSGGGKYVSLVSNGTNWIKMSGN